MKWAGLALFIIIIPIVVAWLRSSPADAPKVWLVFGFLPFVLDPIHGIVAPISWPTWSGYSKGVEISIVDTLAVAILLSRPNIGRLAPFPLLWAAYFTTATLSILSSPMPMATVFAAWQILRVAIIAWAAASICAMPRGPRFLLMGMCLGLAVNAGFSFQQRLSGDFQANGLYSHQNFLGMVSHFVAFPALALFISDTRQRIMLLGVGAAMLVAIFGASRATIGLAGAGYGLLLAVSLLRKPSNRKWGLTGLAVLALAAVTPFAFSSLEQRFERTEAPTSDYDEREAFKDTAKAMLAAHPMGVGANQYVFVSNTQGYSDEGGVAAVFGSRAAHVHHTYLLVAAESGYLGLAALLLIMYMPLAYAVRTAWKYRNDPRGELLLGFAVSLAVVAIHCFFEWVFMTYAVQILFGMAVGGIFGLSKQIAFFDARTRRLKTKNDETVARKRALA